MVVGVDGGVDGGAGWDDEVTDDSPLQMEVARSLITAKRTVLRALLLIERESDIERRVRMRILAYDFDFSTGMLLRRFLGYARPGALNDCILPRFEPILNAPPPKIEFKPLVLDTETAATLQSSLAEADESLAGAAKLLLENADAWPWTGSTLLNRICAVGTAWNVLRCVRREFALTATENGRQSDAWGRISNLAQANAVPEFFLGRRNLEDHYADYTQPHEWYYDETSPRPL